MCKLLRIVALIAGGIAATLLLSGCFNMEVEMWIDDETGQNGRLKIVLTTDNFTVFSMLKAAYYESAEEGQETPKATFVEDKAPYKIIWEGTFKDLDEPMVVATPVSNGIVYKIRLMADSTQQRQEPEEDLSLFGGVCLYTQSTSPQHHSISISGGIQGLYPRIHDQHGKSY